MGRRAGAGASAPSMRSRTESHAAAVSQRFPASPDAAHVSFTDSSTSACLASSAAHARTSASSALGLSPATNRASLFHIAIGSYLGRGVRLVRCTHPYSRERAHPYWSVGFGLKVEGKAAGERVEL